MAREYYIEAYDCSHHFTGNRIIHCYDFRYDNRRNYFCTVYDISANGSLRYSSVSIDSIFRIKRNHRFNRTNKWIYRIKPITPGLGLFSFNASSWFNENTAPHFAQLYPKGNSYWKPSRSNENEYLQIFLGFPETIYGVEVSGNPLNDEYVTSYQIAYSMDGMSFNRVLYYGQPEVIEKIKIKKMVDKTNIMFIV